MAPRPLSTVIPSLALCIAACPAPQPEPTPPAGEGLFSSGCPVEGRAGARELTLAAERPAGPDALAEPGDIMLFNEVAAFVIQSPERPRTYYHYGGIPVDAVPVSGCAPTGPDAFGEMGFVLGELDIGAFDQSTMRMFRGERVEIVSDGSDGGPAIVDVHGVDDTFWLVEMTLIKDAYLNGRPKAPSVPYGVEMTMRYTLRPGDPVLEMLWSIRGTTGGGAFVTGTLLFPSDESRKTDFALGAVSFGGFGLATQMPWEGISTPSANFAVTMPDGNVGYTEVAGVQALLDVAQAFTPLPVEVGVEERSRFLLSVVEPGAFASAALLDHDREPVPGVAGTAQAAEGAVVDTAGEPVPYAVVEVLGTDGDGVERVMDRLRTGPDGRWSTEWTQLGAAPTSFRATAPGRDASPAGVDAGSLVVSQAGAILVTATQEGGGPVPVRLDLQRADGLRELRYATPQDNRVAVPPGHYELWASRGYEYGVVHAEIDVPEGGEASVEVTLPLHIDTAGWVSIDSHVHAGPSPDSDTLPVDRMRTAAAGGLDVIIATDHEIIRNQRDALVETGLTSFLGWIQGEEVTPPLPEHTNAWPFPERESVRGDPIRWMGHSYPAIWAAQRARGAQVVQVNHARVNGECGILCLVDWDRMSEPTFPSPELLGLPPTEPFWSWDFDAFEVLNDARNPFLDPASPRRTGAFEDWLAFHNLGQRVTGVAVTDVHGLELPGSPRTYIAVPDDAPGTVLEGDITAGVLAGRAQMSLGAFLHASIAGAGPGDDVSVGPAVELGLRVEGIPEVDVRHVTVLANCDEVAEIEMSAPDDVVKFDGVVPFTLDEDAHIVLVAMGADPMPRGLLDYDAANVPRAITNPIFVDADGDGVFTAPGPKTCTWSRTLGPPAAP